MTKFLHLAATKADPRVWKVPFQDALNKMGILTIVENGADMTESERAAIIREHSVLLTSWGACPVPEELARNPGALKYICHVTGTLRGIVPEAIIESSIPVTNWGDTPARVIAEGAMTLLLATIKDIHRQTTEIEAGGWALDKINSGGSLDQLHVGIYGFGMIGGKLADMLRPFNPILHVYDPYADSLPADIDRVESLEELFDKSQAVVVCAALTSETEKSVTADLLARLPRHGLLVNTARGAIIDQEALFAELESGRLRAALDVLEPDVLPQNHPARQWPNLILTAHAICREWPEDDSRTGTLKRMHQVCIDNIQCHLRDKTLRFQINDIRYRISTLTVPNLYTWGYDNQLNNHGKNPLGSRVIYLFIRFCQFKITDKKIRNITCFCQENTVY